MTTPKNRTYFEQLTKGIGNKNVDDDAYSPKNIFHKLTLDFSYESIIFQLPANASDVKGFEDLNANNATQT